MVTRILLLFVLCCAIQAVSIDKRVEEYCRMLLAVYEKDPESELVQGIIEPWICRSLEGMEESDYFLPKVMIWCPLTQHKLEVNCPEHGTKLRTGVWKVSTKVSCEPRLLFDLNGNTLLIARYYVCSSKGIYHRILSSDQLLLKQLQHKCEIPFILSHRSGYTLRFLTHVRVEIGMGINFNEISQSIMRMNMEDFTRRKSLLELVASHHQKQPDEKYTRSTAFEENPLYTYPSDDHIREMFLLNFRQTKPIYEGDMKMLSASSISMFHTFKVCSKVGTTRSSDDKWVTHYGSLFIIINQNGEIVKWSFCAREEFEEVKVLLQELRSRLSVQGKELTHAMVGRCCEWRQMLKTIFGSDLSVKLDLYEAVQRLSDKIQKGAMLKEECMEEFPHVFRRLGDTGEERTMSTASCDIISSQLEDFKHTWSSLLNKEALNELKKLEEHIALGCLSDIPVGHAAQRNEDLNDLLNKSLVTGATRLGPELAFALITVLFYIVNGKVRRKLHGGDVPAQVDFADMNGEMEGESFGFLPSLKNTPVVTSHENTEPDDTPLPVFVQSPIPQSMQEHIKCTNIHNLLQEDILQILVPEALELHDMLSSLSARCKIHKLNVWDFPCIQTEHLVALFRPPKQVQDPVVEEGLANLHDARLRERLNQFNLEIDGVGKDGNCAFTAVASQIRHVFDRGVDPELKEHLQSSGIDENQFLPEMARVLRSLFVKDLITNFEDYYPSIHNLTEEMFLEEAKKFETDGVYTSQLGDFVMKSLSKVLGCAILVISSMTAIEVIPFIPKSLKCKTPLFVAYNQSGSGHYDSTTDKPLNDSKTSIKIAVDSPLGKYAATQGKCRCGKGRNIEPGFVSCTNKSENGKYLTRCPCYRMKLGCSNKCRCSNCGNEYTVKPLEEKPVPSSNGKVLKRKRNCPESKKRKRSEDFIKELSKHPVSELHWSQFESCVFEAGLRFLTASGVDHSSENVFQLYNFLAKSTCVSTLGLALRCKTTTQVTAKLESRQVTGSMISAYSQKIKEALSTLSNEAPSAAIISNGGDSAASLNSTGTDSAGSSCNGDGSAASINNVANSSVTSISEGATAAAGEEPEPMETGPIHNSLSMPVS